MTRDLSEKLEERETAVTDERTTELQTQLDGARKELETMRESRERQAEMVSVDTCMRHVGELLFNGSDPYLYTPFCVKKIKSIRAIVFELQILYKGTNL